jgi:hypothetical protein
VSPWTQLTSTWKRLRHPPRLNASPGLLTMMRTVDEITRTVGESQSLLRFLS